MVNFLINKLITVSAKDSTSTTAVIYNPIDGFRITEPITISCISVQSIAQKQAHNNYSGMICLFTPWGHFFLDEKVTKKSSRKINAKIFLHFAAGKKLANRSNNFSRYASLRKIS